MTAPFVFVTTSKIKKGHLEEYKSFTQKSIEIIEANEPRLIGFGTYLHEESSEVTTIQVHPDADSFLFHLEIIRERMDIAFEHIELKSMTITGVINEQVRAIVKQFSIPGVSVTINPEPLGGFSRFSG